MHSEADAKLSSLWEGKQFHPPAFNMWFMLVVTALSLLQKKYDYHKYIDKFHISKTEPHAGPLLPRVTGLLKTHHLVADVKSWWDTQNGFWSAYFLALNKLGLWVFRPCYMLSSSNFSPERLVS